MSKIVAPSSWKRPESHLTTALSHPWYRNLLDLQDAIHYESTIFFRGRGLKYLFLPITTDSVSSPTALGSDSLPVKAVVFDKEMYLADSMQFLLEYGARIYEGGVWYAMTSFRGEDVDARHLSEFTHIEAEITGSLNEVIGLVEDYLRHLAASILENHESIVEQVCDGVTHVERIANSGTFPRIRFDEAKIMLKDMEGALRTPVPGITVLTGLGERKLIDLFGDAVWVTHFPTGSVPFYQKSLPDLGISLCADLLMGSGEMVGAGERHFEADKLAKEIADQGILSGHYKWYVDMKRIHPLQTSGFGMGLERFLLWLCRSTDIRDFQLVLRNKGVTSAP